MREQVINLRRQRANLVAQARELNDQVENEDRSMTAEEQQRWDGLMDEAGALLQRTERLERQMEADASIRGAADDGGQEQRRMGSGDEPGAENGQQQQRADPRDTPEYNAAFRSYIMNGQANMSAVERRAVLQADQDLGGGFLVAPRSFVNELIQGLDDMVIIRQHARKFTLETAASMGVPSLDTDLDDFEWTSELGTGSDDENMEFGGREFHPKPLAKRIRVSRRLLRLVPDAEDLVRERLQVKVGYTQENSFMTGAGAVGPLGLFTATSQGISTARDVATGNNTTAPTFDGLINAKYALKEQYWVRSRWFFHRDTTKEIAKLKDGNGQYLWRESVRVGEPDRVLSFPIHNSEFVPNTLTTGQYVGILGDFNFYWIADALDMEVQRLVELYAASNQIGLIARLETDGMPVLEEAFVRVKLA